MKFNRKDSSGLRFRSDSTDIVRRTSCEPFEFEIAEVQRVKTHQERNLLPTSTDPKSNFHFTEPKSEFEPKNSRKIP